MDVNSEAQAWRRPDTDAVAIPWAARGDPYSQIPAEMV